jgi:hypothetical protein
MIDFIKRRQRIEVTTYSRDWDFTFEPGSGFSFPCDKNGVIDTSELTEHGHANLAACLNGVFMGRMLTDRGIVEHTHSYTEPAVIRCACQAEVVLTHDGVVCENCAQMFNLVGQRIMPEHLWE